MFYIIGLSRLNIYKWICHALVEDSLKTLKVHKRQLLRSSFFLFFPFYFFAGNSHGYNKLSLWRGPRIIILSKFGLLWRFMCVCVCVFKGYVVFPPNEKIPPLFQNYKGKEISKAPSVYLVISKEKMYVCVWVYTEAYMCIPTHTHTHKVHTVYGSSNM